MKRFLEIEIVGDIGIAVAEPAADSPFSTETQIPPSEILLCPCRGMGVICHHVYAGIPDHPNEAHRVDRHYDIHGPQVKTEAQVDWMQRHTGPRCRIIRKFFVDVTDRPDAQQGMKYDEATDTFSAAPVDPKN